MRIAIRNSRGGHPDTQAGGAVAGSGKANGDISQ